MRARANARREEMLDDETAEEELYDGPALAWGDASGPADEEDEAADDRLESKIVATLFAVLSGAAFAYFVGVVWFNVLVPHHFPRLASEPNFESARWGTQDIFTILLTVNALPPVLGALSVLASGWRTGPFLYRVVSPIAGVVSLAVAAYYFFVWWLQTNASGSGLSISNDYRWCGIYFGDAPEYCANTTPFVPAVTTLSTNVEFVQLWIASGVFTVLGFVHMWVARFVKRHS